MSKTNSEEKCDCRHELSFAITMGDGCLHVVPHPTQEQFDEEIKPMLDLLSKEYEDRPEPKG